MALSDRHRSRPRALLQRARANFLHPGAATLWKKPLNERLDPVRARLSVVLNHLLVDDYPLLLQFDHVTVPMEATSRS